MSPSTKRQTGTNRYKTRYVEKKNPLSLRQSDKPGQTDIKHEMWREKKNHLAQCHFGTRIVGEKLPPSQKSSLAKWLLLSCYTVGLYSYPQLLRRGGFFPFPKSARQCNALWFLRPCLRGKLARYLSPKVVVCCSPRRPWSVDTTVNSVRGQ